MTRSQKQRLRKRLEQGSAVGRAVRAFTRELKNIAIPASTTAWMQEVGHEVNPCRNDVL
ncbi:MAG: hypothetical protein ACXWFX_15600 [Methylobacter sp.]